VDRVRGTVRFLVNCYQTYVIASPKVRRQLNQAMFEAFYVGTDGALTAKPTEWFRQLLRTDVLRPAGSASPRLSTAKERHDSGDWEGGVPQWIVEEQAQQGQSSESRTTPVFQGLGLNKGYLAEGVGFEPTVRRTYNGFRDRPIRPLSHPSREETRRRALVGAP
jgi:hypothetical protein